VELDPPQPRRTGPLNAQRPAALLFGRIGYFAGAIGQWLQRKPRLALWLDRVAGSIFVALGLRLIVMR
jgi:threonine/homoserine/homoserine lactone efflux protein